MPTASSPADLASFALHYLEADKAARLFVNHEMGVIWTNPAAMQLIDSLDEIGLADQRLWLKNRAEHQVVAERLAAPHAPDRSIVPVTISDGHILIEVSAVKPPAEAPLFALRLMPARHTVAPHFPHLDDVFGLTLAEYRTLLGLLNGQTADMLAVRDELSIETVRTHIRRIYTKMGVSSREAMFARLRPYLIS